MPMLAEPITHEPRRVPRRYARGELLLAAFVAARRPLTFHDLAHVLTDSGARVSDVAEWLATAQESGLVADEGYEAGERGEPIGPRRFSLSGEARAELRARRVERRRRFAA